MEDSTSGLSEFDRYIYSRETVRKLKESGLEIEDVHALSETKSTFQRRISALLSSEEKPTLDLVASVRKDENDFMEEGKNSIAFRDKNDPVGKFWLKFLGKNVELWKALLVIAGIYCDEDKLKQLYVLRSVFERSPDLLVRLSNLTARSSLKEPADDIAVLEKFETTELLEQGFRLISESYEKYHQINKENSSFWNPEIFVTHTLFQCIKDLEKVDSASFGDLMKEKTYIDGKISRHEKGGWIHPSAEEIKFLYELREDHKMETDKMDGIYEQLKSLSVNEKKLLPLFTPLIKEHPADIARYIEIIKELNVDKDKDYVENIICIFQYTLKHDMDMQFAIELVKHPSRATFISDILKYVSPENEPDRFLRFLLENSNDRSLTRFLPDFVKNHHELIHSDIDLFFQVISFWRRNKEKQNFISIDWDTVSSLKHLYEGDLQILDKVTEVFIKNREKLNRLHFLFHNKKFNRKIINEVEKIQVLIDLIAAIPGGREEVRDIYNTIRALEVSDIIGVNTMQNLLLAVRNKYPNILLKKYANWLTNLREIHENDLRKMEIIAEYMTHSDIQHNQTISKYIELHLTKGADEANEYINSLKEEARGLVGSSAPEKHRKLEEYGYLVRYVFPPGNYSTHEKNLKCGDKLEHLEKYQFDRDGYPVTLTGLLGYKVKEGTEPDQQLLGTYTERLGKIRQFVASRGPDNEALQKTFEEKIDRIFEEKAWTEFREITDLTLKEKMLCLFLGEAIRRKQKEQSGKPDVGICDLIVEYKYAFHEDLEAYVARSADSVKAYRDKASQDYMLLAELSVIYGENVKHILRHNIFEELEDSKNYDRIVEVFSEKLGGSSENRDLTPKQWERIDNTFSNDRIPPEKRSEVLYKQIYGIFSSNIEFESDEQRQDFVDKSKDIFAELGDDLTVERFRELLPKFYKLRALYRSEINAELTRLFTYDINQIFEELAKYEESIEEEAKEKRMGGKKEKEVKKSTKKRDIRGYFTKTAETANARMGAYLCIAGDTEMWDNENYFEMVLVDEETNKCVGVVMLLEVKGKDGRKYLWFGPNPFESFLDLVSSQACYQYLYEKTCEFAEQNNFAGVVVPPKEEQILSQCTNRGGDFPGFIKASRLRDKSDKLIVVDFDKKHTLGGSYGYEDGALIWKKGKAA